MLFDRRCRILRLLDQDDFDPDACKIKICHFVWSILECECRSDLKLKMANSTEAELRSLQSSLQSSKDGVALDLQRNVFKK